MLTFVAYFANLRMYVRNTFWIYLLPLDGDCVIFFSTSNI